MKIHRVLTFVLVSSAFILTGCSTNSMHLDGSRAALYDSVAAIAADSGVVATVKVGSQVVLEAEIPYTVSTVEVEQTFSPDGLGENLPEEARGGVMTGDRIDVRQLGTAEYASLPAPLMKTGSTYLLFLTPTMLKGEAGADFFVVGGNAGIYSSDGKTYTHGEFPDGDKLPEVLSEADLAGP